MTLGIIRDEVALERAMERDMIAEVGVGQKVMMLIRMRGIEVEVRRLTNLVDIPVDRSQIFLQSARRLGKELQLGLYEIL